MAEPHDQYPSLIAKLEKAGGGDISLDEFEQVAALLSAEAAERMRIVEDLANSEPAPGAMLACRYCFGHMVDGARVAPHRDDCLWVRARKAVGR